MDEHDFFISLRNIDTAIRVRYERERGRVFHFVVQLEAYLNKDWCPISRYDNAHGFIHRDDLRPDGTELKSPPMTFESNEAALDYAIEDFRQNCRLYIERYRQWTHSQ